MLMEENGNNKHRSTEGRCYDQSKDPFGRNPEEDEKLHRTCNERENELKRLL